MLVYAGYYSRWVLFMLSIIYAKYYLCWVLFMLSIIYAEYYLWVLFMLSIIYAEYYFMPSFVYADYYLCWMFQIGPLCRVSLYWVLWRCLEHASCFLCWLSHIVLSVIMLSVVKLSVGAPLRTWTCTNCETENDVSNFVINVGSLKFASDLCNKDFYNCNKKLRASQLQLLTEPTNIRQGQSVLK